MSSTTNTYLITIPTFGDITNISGSFSYNGGPKVPCADFSAPSGLEQYYCTANDMNNISIAINAISKYLNQGKTSKTSVYTKQYIDDTFYTKSYISGNYYTKSYISENYYTKTDINNKFTNYYTISEIKEKYYTISDINRTFYTKTDINNKFYTKTYIKENYFTQSETITQIVNAYKSQKIDLPVDNISIKANTDGELYVNLKGGSEFHLKNFSPKQQYGVIHAFNDGINLLWDYTLSSRVISDLPDAFIEKLSGEDEKNKMKDAAKNLYYLTVNLDNATLSSSIDKGIFINYTENHFFEPSGKFALKFNTNMFYVDNSGLNAKIDNKTLVDLNGIGVNIDAESLVVDNTEGIGVAIDNNYIVLGNGGKHAGNTNYPTTYGLTLGDTWKQKIKDAPVYIPPAKGNIVFLYGTVSKIMNAISGFLSDSCCATNFANIQDATWVFPFGTSPYNTTSHKGIYKDVLSSALFNIDKFFANSNTDKPYLRFKADDKINITNITTGGLPTQNLIINSNGKSSFQIYVFPIPEDEFFTLPFGLFDEYPNFTEENVSRPWKYYYTNFDGAWKYSNGELGPASNKDTTWEWTGSTTDSISIKSIRGMWDNDVIPNFELPSSVWKYQKYTPPADSTYQWSWQIKGSPDYFNPYGILLDGDGGREKGYLNPALSGIPVSTLYTYNRFKYSPGIYRPSAFNNIIQMLSTLRITGNSTFYIVFLNHMYFNNKPVFFDQPDCIPGSLGNIVFCSYYSFLLKIKSGMIPPYDLFNRYYQFNDTKLSGSAASTDTEQWYDLNIAFNLNSFNHENLYEMPYIVFHPSVDVNKLKKPLRAELGMTTRVWMQTNSSQILFKRIAFL